MNPQHNLQSPPFSGRFILAGLPWKVAVKPNRHSRVRFWRRSATTVGHWPRSTPLLTGGSVADFMNSFYYISKGQMTTLTPGRFQEQQPPRIVRDSFSILGSPVCEASLLLAEEFPTMLGNDATFCTALWRNSGVSWRVYLIRYDHDHVKTKWPFGVDPYPDPSKLSRYVQTFPNALSSQRKL